MSARGIAQIRPARAPLAAELERARFALAAAKDLRDVRTVHLKARVLKKDAAAAQDVELVGCAAMLLLRAERKGGRMLAAGVECAGTGIGTRQAGNWCRRAALTDESFAAALEVAQHGGLNPQPSKETAHMVSTKWRMIDGVSTRYRVGVCAQAVADGADEQALAGEAIRQHEGDLRHLVEAI